MFLVGGDSETVSLEILVLLGVLGGSLVLQTMFRPHSNEALFRCAGVARPPLQMCDAMPFEAAAHFVACAYARRLEVLSLVGCTLTVYAGAAATRRTSPSCLSRPSPS